MQVETAEEEDSGPPNDDYKRADVIPMCEEAAEEVPGQVPGV